MNTLRSILMYIFPFCFMYEQHFTHFTFTFVFHFHEDRGLLVPVSKKQTT